MLMVIFVFLLAFFYDKLRRRPTIRARPTNWIADTGTMLVVLAGCVLALGDGQSPSCADATWYWTVIAVILSAVYFSMYRPFLCRRRVAKRDVNTQSQCTFARHYVSPRKTDSSGYVGDVSVGLYYY